MPMARTRRGRLRQIERWLNVHFPPPRPTCVVMYHFPKAQGEQGRDQAETFRNRDRICIRIGAHLKWYPAIDALLHEWAHAVVWPLARAEHYQPSHGDEWAVTYGKIYRRYFDEGGYLESRDYEST